MHRENPSHAREVLGLVHTEAERVHVRRLQAETRIELNGRERRGELDHRASPAPGRGSSESSTYDEMPDEASPQDAQAVATEQLGRAEKILASWSADDRYLFLAKLNGVSARVIQQTLERPPFNCFAAVTTVDSRFHRLRQRLIEDIREP